MQPRRHGRRDRLVRLLVDVCGLSGRRYPAGTVVAVAGGGAAVDGFVGGDWLALSWWEFAELPGGETGQPPSSPS
jgi:hypothetical protein